jgi:outer membrane protein TolC
VLETQRGALQAQSSLLEARRRRLDARIDLHLALGGGFGAEPPAAIGPDPSPEDSRTADARSRDLP